MRKTAILAVIGGTAMTVGALVVPPPEITVTNPKILYTFAMYKAAVGDTGSAQRLMRRAENATHHPPQDHNAPPCKENL